MTDQSKMSRRQFVGTAAAGAVALGAVAGATKFAPHLTVAGEKREIPVSKIAAPIAAQAQSTVSAIPSSWDYTADVVCIGNGGAGTAAAIAAYDGGASVLILEKAPKGLDLGNTGVSGGTCTMVSPLTDWITIVNMACFGTTPLDVVTAFCTEVSNLPSWVASLGGSMIINPSTLGYPPSFFQNYVSADYKCTAASCAVPAFSYPLKGNSVTGAAGAGKDFMGFLDNCRATRNIPVMYQTPAKQLIQNPTTNEILGVVATSWTGQDIYVRANKGVILACGGYENNPEMKANFAPESPKSEFITFYGTPYNTGDGIYMAEQVGAKLWHMNKKEVHAIACAAASVEVGDGLVVDNLGFGCPGALLYPVIYANRYGQRFMNEYGYSGHSDQTKAYDEFSEEFLATEGVNFCDWPNQPFYAIFDSLGMKYGPMALTGGPGHTPQGSRYNGLHQLYNWSSDNSAELAKGWIVTADNPQDLGAKIVCRDFFGAVVGMDPAGLAATVTAWNAACTAGSDTAFGRPKTTLKPLSNPPFYAMQLIECQTNTDGGPAHDKYTRTLDVNDNPIPRLYTPGELGSLWGGLYYGGGNVPEAIAMGRVAGANAATLPSWV